MIENPRPTFLYRIFQLLAYLGALPFVVNTVDILLHPTALPLDGTLTSRLVAGLLIAPVTLIIAILCVRRAPDNLIGWMLVTFAYGTSSLNMRGDILPLTPTLLIANFFITIFWFSYLLIPLYFPNGRLYPPRLNRWGNPLVAVIFCLLAMTPLVFSPSLEMGEGEALLRAANPLFIVSFNYEPFTQVILVIALVVGLGSVLLRYRGGDPLQRLQLRWLLVGVIGQFGVLFLDVGLAQALNINLTIVSALYTVIIPTAIGVAILRHRLYDIDIIIRKTLIYSILTGMLALIYFGAVVLTQRVLRVATGETPDIAIVISTLLIAALFNPLRHRIQQTIDRRFYRRKYDAERTLARFNQTLRDEVDVGTLQKQLIGVIHETMQPDRMAMWIRSDVPNSTEPGIS